MFGYGVWAWLLARYPAATVAPLSLLVPVFGFAASALILGETAAGLEDRRGTAGDGRDWRSTCSGQDAVAQEAVRS